MNAAAILKRKGSNAVTVFPDASIREAMRLLIKHRVGSLVVLSEAREVIGIVTERDIFRLTYEHEGKIMDIPVSAVMIACTKSGGDWASWMNAGSKNGLGLARIS